MTQPKLFSTGNEYVSIPNVSAATAGIESVGFMHSSYKACIELHGRSDTPLFSPIVEMDGKNIFTQSLVSKLDNYWVPVSSVASAGLIAQSIVFAPIDRRGFVCVITLENTTDSDINVKAGWKGCWDKCMHTAKISKPMYGFRNVYMSDWEDNAAVLEFQSQIPLFALACLPKFDSVVRSSVGAGSDKPVQLIDNPLTINEDTSVNYSMLGEFTIKPAEKLDIPLYVGIGLKEVSAVAAAKEMRLQGWSSMYAVLKSWLSNHTIACEDDDLKAIININSFYNYFYSQAITLDTEQLVAITSRTSASDCCAEYNDINAMRWSLPAILQINWSQGRKLLIYGFTTQLPNVGTKSRYIDGIVMEPGMQLDQLCSPIRALYIYVKLTDDLSILFDRRVQIGINTIQQILAAQRHSDITLFESLYKPSGDYSKYPYICFSNVLVWRILLDMGVLYRRIRDLDRADEAFVLANKVKAAVLKNLVVDGPFGKMFAFSTDLAGNYELADDPVGSLQFIAHLGFCNSNDTVYKNTVAWIHSEHNKQNVEGTALKTASLINLLNELLVDKTDEAIKSLKNKVATNDIVNGDLLKDDFGSAEGRGNAGLAGYLAYVLRHSLGLVPPETAVVKEGRRPSETLYQPPPEAKLDTKKARL